MSVANKSLNINAVTVTGIIHGTSNIPLIGFASVNLWLKKRARIKPIINWKTKHKIVYRSVLNNEVLKTLSLKSSK